MPARGVQNANNVVSDIYTPDKHLEAVNVMGADDNAHPAVSYLHNKTKELYVGGKVQAVQAPNHFDYVPLRCKLTFHVNISQKANL